ncbi:MAG TPA: hypothetical protein VJC16_01280, partial [Candidatus Nanoarchaeia archaeon]|nr:hypothetical protein [Candidatus Nanoarchaeia archaeon]
MTSTEHVRRFITEVIRLKEREHLRRRHHQKVAERISGIKQLSLKGASQKTVMDHFALLEQEVQEALAAERELAQQQHSAASDVQMLKDKVESISRRLQEERGNRGELQEIAAALDRIHLEVRERKLQKRAFEKRSAHLE